MFKHLRSIKKIIAVSAVLFFTFLSNLSAQDAAAGKAIFSANCASCHKMDKDLTGPALMGADKRWNDDKALHGWIKNWQKEVATGNPYAVKIKDWSPSVMNIFESLPDGDIDNVIAYIKSYTPPIVVAATNGEPAAKESGDSSILFGIITLILGIVALILLGVNSNLKKLTDDKEGIRSPEPVAFYKNKVYLLFGALVFFVLGGFFLAKGAIGLGRHKGYEPEQPIFYSHKVHAGTNQINCLYCHGGAQEGKHSNIPSINVCMNCHMAINSYDESHGKIYDGEGKEVNGTAQIQELYKYAGFDPAKSKIWDASKAKPVQWKQIHNLPDHVYFNHSQHVVAGKVACQTCHGEIQKMDEVKQFADLSMGWCINCHRESKVQFNDEKGNGNKFYSIYEKFHDDIKHGKIDSVTVEMIGGTECQKCHY